MVTHFKCGRVCGDPCKNKPITAGGFVLPNTVVVEDACENEAPSDERLTRLRVLKGAKF
jgi:hypothetical protein